MPEFELPDVSDIFSQMKDASSAVSEGKIDDAVGNLRERMGQARTDTGFLSIDSDGTIKVNGNEIKSLSDLESALKSMPDGPAKTNLINALKNPDLGNVTPDVQEKATSQGVAANQRENLRETFPDKNDPLRESKWTSFQNMLAKSSAELFKKVMSYSVLFGASYAMLDAMASGRTGCYGVSGSQKEMIYKTSSSADCPFFNSTTPNTPPYIISNNINCQMACTDFTQNNAPTAAQLNALKPAPSNMSCNCVDSTGALVNPNVSIVYEQPTAFDIFGNILNGMGMFIEKVADGVLKIVQAAADVLTDLPKILMWVGIAAAIVGVIVGFIYLGKKMHDKKKAKQGLQGGCWGSSKGSSKSAGNLRGGCWGKKKQFKHWKKTMKHIQKSTPYSHMTMSQALFD